MKRVHWMASYAATALVGLVLAYVVSSKVMSKARGQTPPVEASLPAEGGATEAAKIPPPPMPTETAQGTAAPRPPAPPANAPTNVPAGASVNELPPVSSGTAVAGDAYSYDGTGRRDPFRPYRSSRPDSSVKVKGPNDEVPLEPLQKVDVESLSIMGILWDVKQPRALVRDGGGQMHTLVRNTKVGRYNGYVAAIREGEVVVIETIEDEGRQIKRTKILEFKK